MAEGNIWNLNKGTKAFCFSIVCVLTAILVPRLFSPVMETLSEVTIERHVMYAFWFALSFLIAGEMIGIFENQNSRFNFSAFLLFLITSTLASFSLLFVVWIVEYQFIGRIALFKIALSSGLGNFLVYESFQSLSLSQKKNVFLDLSSKDCEKIKTALSDTKGRFKFMSNSNLKDKSEFRRFCLEEKIDLVVVESEKNSENIEIIPLLQEGIKFMGIVEFYEKFLGKIPSNKINQPWLVRLDLRFRNPVGLRLKRCLDLIVAVFGLIIAFPLLVLSQILVVIESGFPSFFTQKRTGFLGKTYTLIKLRTMVKNAEGNGAKWAQHSDDRITKVGSFLRKWRIDEIPQFWNVIKGDMSIVGPRPERPEFQEELINKIPHWNCRHLVKPGLTGWAQIKFRYTSDTESSEEKLAYDLYYIKNASILLDIQIILSTLRSVAKGSR